MATTRSRSRAKSKDTVQDEAPVSVKQEPSLASNKGTNMSENSSIIEFAEDISAAEAPPPLPISEYSAEIRAAEAKTSAKGNKYGSVTFFIPPEQYPADFTDGDPDGITLIYNRAPAENKGPAGPYRMRKWCESIGAPMGKTVDMNDWIGCTATISVDHEEYEGEKRAVIKRVVAA